MGAAERARRLLPGLWAGWLLCVALLATPAPFATLAASDAGRVVGRMLAQEAYTSLVLGVVVLLLERLAARRAATAGQGSRFSTGMALALGALFCTVAGYYAVQPMLLTALSVSNRRAMGSSTLMMMLPASSAGLPSSSGLAIRS